MNDVTLYPNNEPRILAPYEGDRPADFSNLRNVIRKQFIKAIRSSIAAAESEHTSFEDT